MPMPPPKPSSEGTRDRRTSAEMSQIVRALRAEGPTPPEDLARLVGAPYWDTGRFDSALAMCVADGLAVRQPDGRIVAP